ncbi:MAG: S9 family peptidase [Acidobacteria bacterium]|nr:S9 family peptidase [Acidobacteriota bacterium]
MRKTLGLGFATALLVSATVSAETHPFSVHDMLAMDRISDPRVSPSGQLVAFTVRVTDLDANKGRTDIYLASVDGSWVRRITTSDASDTQARWSPDGQALYFVSTRSGSSQVWRIASGGGEAEQVTKLPLDVDALEVSPTGKFLVIAMPVFPGKSVDETKAAMDEKEKTKATGMLFDHLFVRHWDTWADGTRNHIFAYDLTAGKATDLMPAMDADCPGKPFGGSEDFSISPDGKTIVFSARDAGREEAWSTNLDIFSVPSDASAAPTKLTTNPATDAQPRFSPDGATLAYLAMDRAGYEADRYRIVLRDWATGSERSIDLRADATLRGDRSPAEYTWSADNREIYCTADHIGQHSLFAVDIANGKARIVVNDGQIASPQPVTGGRILYSMNSLLGPAELYSIGADDKDIRSVTTLNSAKVASARFGKPEQFSFRGAKGDTVYGYIVHPADFDATKKYPVAFLIHGGPQGSFGNDFHYRWNPQAYAGAGYAAVMIDFHGSTGYGQAFTDAITGDWGGAPYQDLMLGLDAAIKKYPFLDGTRVGALGASFGGYMVNWVAGMAPTRFKALVCHDGNLDERMAYFDTEELWFPEWDHAGMPWTNPLGYSKHNPIDLVKNWKTPMLVVHGGKDYRVVDTQGLSTFNALQRRGIPSKLLYFPDENHWVLKPHNSILWHNTVIGWLDQWLK